MEDIEIEGVNDEGYDKKLVITKSDFGEEETGEKDIYYKIIITGVRDKPPYNGETINIDKEYLIEALEKIKNG